MKILSNLLSALVCIFFASIASAQQPMLPSSWSSAGSAPKNYDMTLDTVMKRSGSSSARIAYKDGDPKEFGALVQRIDAIRYRGKRLMLSAWLKTSEATSAHIWMRIHSTPTLMTAFDNMRNRAVTGTSGWHRYDVVLDVPKDATYVAFGAFLIGKGTLWVDDFEFNLVEGSVPSTNLLTPEDVKENTALKEPKDVLKTPTDLGFEP